MEINAEWWLQEDEPRIGILFDDEQVLELSRLGAQQLAGKLQACLNGIIEHLARYYIVESYGTRHHLISRDGYGETAPAICGATPRVFKDTGEQTEWFGKRPLASQPEPHFTCLRCLKKYERLEVPASA
jgi:hypothetical protein